MLLSTDKIIKEKIDKTCTFLDFDEENTKAFIKDTTSNNTSTKDIVMPIYDIHNKIFGPKIDEDRIITTIYEILSTPDHIPILKSIICKASHPDNHPTLGTRIFHIFRFIW